MAKQIKKGTLLDIGSKYFIILGSSTEREAKFCLVDTREQLKAVVTSWKRDGLSGEYAVFKNDRVGKI